MNDVIIDCFVLILYSPHQAHIPEVYAIYVGAKRVRQLRRMRKGRLGCAQRMRDRCPQSLTILIDASNSHSRAHI